jgi:3-phenylpropionate/trans-cinnamate dioxygenase ferredoxin reductase subunit
LLDGPAAEAFAPVPYFWSDQYDAKIQFAGRLGDVVQVVEGSLEDRRFVALYGRAGRLVGVLGISRPRLVMKYRRLIAARTSWEEALAAAAAPAGGAPASP